MRTFVSILLLSVIFLQTFSFIAIQANYFFNKNFIAANFCVNKDKPQMHCNGKCYLSKQLDTQEKQDQKTSTTKKEKFDIQPFFISEKVSVPLASFLIKIEFRQTEDDINPHFIHTIFHPPAV